MVVKRFTS